MARPVHALKRLGTVRTLCHAPGPIAPAAPVVVVTGGAVGIGRAVCEAFVATGARVLAADVQPRPPSFPNAVAFVQADVSQAAECERVVQEAGRLWGEGARVGVLVNNAGIQTDNGRPVHLLPEDVWDRVMAVNLKSYFLMAKMCIPGMLAAKHGVIINVASVQAHQSQVGIPAYAASKGAIVSLTRQLALDYSSHHIRCVSVSPGTIRTPLVERLVQEDGQTCEELGARYPSGRMGDPADVADLCVFLASPKAKNIAGCDVVCDGGMLAMGGWDRRIGFDSYA